jgi:hypothetical protein
LIDRMKRSACALQFGADAGVRTVGPVSDFSELASQGPGRSIAVAARPDSDAYSTWRNLGVGNDADVPEERAFGVRHEIARVGEIRVADLLLRQSVRRWLAAASMPQSKTYS